MHAAAQSTAVQSIQLYSTFIEDCGNLSSCSVNVCHIAYMQFKEHVTCKNLLSCYNTRSSFCLYTLMTSFPPLRHSDQMPHRQYQYLIRPLRFQRINKWRINESEPVLIRRPKRGVKTYQDVQATKVTGSQHNKLQQLPQSKN